MIVSNKNILFNNIFYLTSRPSLRVLSLHIKTIYSAHITLCIVVYIPSVQTTVVLVHNVYIKKYIYSTYETLQTHTQRKKNWSSLFRLFEPYKKSPTHICCITILFAGLYDWWGSKTIQGSRRFHFNGSRWSHRVQPYVTIYI